MRTTRSSHLAEARIAIAAIAPKFVRLVREGAPTGPVIGHWEMGDLACHVSQAIKVDTDALAGRPLPVAELNPAAVAAANEDMLATDPERNLDVLADRIEAQLQDFLALSEASESDEVTWLADVRLPASAVACHLLEELLVHGFDIARATKQEWTIAPEHAALAIAGAVLPIVNAAGPMAFVKPERAQGFRARLDVLLRGHQRLTFAFDDGFTFREDDSGPVDVHVSADPAAMLLFMLGRLSVPQAVLGGKFMAWGRRPWRLRRMMTVIAPP